MNLDSGMWGLQSASRLLLSPAARLNAATRIIAPRYEGYRPGVFDAHACDPQTILLGFYRQSGPGLSVQVPKGPTKIAG